MVRVMMWMLVATTALAGTAKPAAPAELPDKYAADRYASLKPFERDRCDRYVGELRLMAKRKQLGGRPGDTEKMKARAEQLDKDYTKYCLKQF